MTLTIVTYHYVRDLERSRFPLIKGRSVSEFAAQLDTLSQRFAIVTVAQIVAALKGEAALPPRAAWLTFDDGYLDHYVDVWPLLQRRGWQGSFFPVVASSRDGELLDVNKIQFILAASPDADAIVARIKRWLQDHDAGATFDSCWSAFGHIAGRFDTAPTAFTKRLLQRELPEPIRSRLIEHLFAALVSADARAFAGDLYMTADQLQDMIAGGMYVGNHSARHQPMDMLTAEQQAIEIDQAQDFLGSIGAPLTDWIMCYPFGRSNAELVAILKARGCIAALTVKPGDADLAADDALLLPRRDTNELPIYGWP